MVFGMIRATCNLCLRSPRRLSTLRHGWILGCLIGLGLFLLPQHGQASDPVETPRARDALKFELDIQPILTARGCNSGPCHGKSRGQNGFALSLLGFDADLDYHAILKDARGRRIHPSAPEKSLFVLKATGEMPHGGGVRVEPNSEEYRDLVEWIRIGSPRTTAADPTLVSLKILPEPRSMQAAEVCDLKILATYSDGSQRDVTRVSAYLSNEPAVVAVDPQGRLLAGDLPGEATIMARYMGRIATWSTAIPGVKPIAPDALQAFPRQNFIDDRLCDKLELLHLLPSEPCDEHRYLRRIFLDSIGRLPSPEECREYFGDTRPDRRAQWIDRLLARPEYADFWANKWADLLRPNPYRVGIKATMSLDGWLRDVFRRNLPYDQFVRELLTAQGSTWRNGAVTVFRDRREPDELVTITSQLFLGVRLDCAKCHQHPFEVYGQKDFYSLAAFFKQVGFKGTGLSPPISGGEEIVFVKKDGEVKHPLTQQVLPPTTLDGKTPELAVGEDPRRALMAWMSASDNPYFAKVAANRIWAELFGVGLVDPVDDMRATNPASNPALLESLAQHFREVGFDQKQFLKTIMLSSTYALASRPNETNGMDHRNFSRHYRQRMRAEVLADAISDVTQVPLPIEDVPLGTRAVQLWTHRIESEILDAFGRPDANQDPPCERLQDGTIGQALHLMNAQSIQENLKKEGGRCHRLATSDATPEAIIEELYLAIFTRLPSPEEVHDLCAEFAKPEVDRRKLVEDLMWSMLNAPEFLFKD